jgi:hypothetical protein
MSMPSAKRTIANTVGITFYCIGIVASFYMFYKLNELGVKGYSWIILLSCIIATISVVTRMSIFAFIAAVIALPLAGFIFSADLFSLGLIFLSYILLGAF